MPNVFAGLLNALRLEIEQQPEHPLHVGEVMSCWTYLAMMDEATVFMQIGMNTTTDEELLTMLQESTEQCSAQSTKLRDFMKKEGIPLPPTSEEKPKSEADMIPFGAKMTDDEIANGMSIKTAAAIVHCAAAASQSIRQDVGILFVRFMNEKIVSGASMKEMMSRRGWLKSPPAFLPPGAPL